MNAAKIILTIVFFLCISLLNGLVPIDVNTALLAIILVYLIDKYDNTTRQ